MNAKFKESLSAAGIAVVIVLIGAATYVWWLLHTDEFGSKKEYSILQVIEYDHRDVSLTSIEFLEQSGRHFVCVPSNSSKRIWIMLDPRYSPYYKQMPAGQFSITRDDFHTIIRETPVNETVKACLESHIVGSSE